jgi:hypothetical protein
LVTIRTNRFGIHDHDPDLWMLIEYRDGARQVRRMPRVVIVQKSDYVRPRQVEYSAVIANEAERLRIGVVPDPRVSPLTHEQFQCATATVVADDDFQIFDVLREDTIESFQEPVGGSRRRHAHGHPRRHVHRASLERSPSGSGPV